MLDTHVWIWWVDEQTRLSQDIVRAITEAEEENAIVLSVASIWEVAIKVSRGRLRLPLDLATWIERATAYPGFIVEPIGIQDSLLCTQLPGPLHNDPFDRLLIALSQRLNARLVTLDRKLVNYPHVATIA